MAKGIRALGTRRPLLEETYMKKTLTTLLAAATVAAALAGSATTASAQRGLVPGLLGGFVAGAIVGGAIAASRPPGYVVYPGYAAPLSGPSCYWTRLPVYDPYGNIVGWRGRPVQVCQ
jgi:hypothetical protein